MLFACLLTSILQTTDQDWFWLSSLIIEEIHFIRAWLPWIVIPPMDLGSQLKTWKAFTILDAAKNTKNICYSWKEVPTLTWVWRTKTSAPTGDFEGIQDFSGRMDCRCVERARNLELKLGPEDAPELLPSHDKTWTDKKFFLWMTKESGQVEFFLVKMLWSLLKWPQRI